MANFGIIVGDKIVGYMTFNNIIDNVSARWQLLNMLQVIKSKSGVSIFKTYEIGYCPEDKTKISLSSYECGSKEYSCSQAMQYRVKKQSQ